MEGRESGSLIVRIGARVDQCNRQLEMALKYLRGQIGTASTAPKECDEEKGGTSYWGKVTFQMSDAGRTYTGKWGYCDAEPDTDFQAKWDGK